jgi:hypothetical protein
MAATVLAAVTATQMIASRKDERATFQIIVFPLHRQILGVLASFGKGLHVLVW